MSRRSITKRADGDIWQLDPKINALGPVVNKYMALLHSNLVARDRACVELDRLFESNPKAFFEQGFDQVDDRFMFEGYQNCPPCGTCGRLRTGIFGCQPCHCTTRSPL